MASVRQPSGTVTMVFTDIEGSTKLLEQLGTADYRAALAEHRRIVREACSRHHGYEVDYEGDAFFYAFASAQDAVSAVADAMTGLEDGPIRIRVGIHTGTPELDPPKYVGMDVHTAARIMASGHGGQVVISPSTAPLVEAPLQELGEHRLKDIAEPIPLYQLGGESFPPLKTISNTNLPRPASAFVGREREVREVLDRVADGARLVTLTGPGGSGKTRLALETASTLVAEYKAGVFWIGLAALRDSALVTETIAQTLGAKDGLADHIGEREMLLLIDNLEQVIDAAPGLSLLLTTCRNLTLLVTSRELLRVHGEVEYAVPPLAGPEAVELFCRRSELEADETIAELCHRLDDLPLAVELAAARTKALSPAQILKRLSQRLDLLRGGRDADPRQQTLRATIEWSHDLLSEAEQRLFRRLSVFAGGCALEAAEEVCDADLDTLQSLTEKSLLRFTNDRYWMLETIREYASERLHESGEAHQVRRRFFDSLLALAEEVDYGSRQREWLEHVQAEHENIRVALRLAPSPEFGLRLAADLGEFWSAKGHIPEGRSSLEALLNFASGAADEIRARGTLVAGELAVIQDDYTAAAALLDAAEKMYTRIGDVGGLGRLMLARGWMAFLTGDLEAAVTFLRDGLQRIEVARRRHLLPRALRMLAVVEDRRGNKETARTLEEQALDAYRDLGEELGIGLILSDMAWGALRRGDYERSRRLASESLVLTGGSMSAPPDPNTQHTLALALMGLGKQTEARQLAQHALRTAWNRHDVFCGSALLDLVAAVEAESGADARAARLAGAAESLLTQVGASASELEAARAVYAPILDRARERAGTTVWQAEFAVGAASSFSEAVEYALGTNA